MVKPGEVTLAGKATTIGLMAVGVLALVVSAFATVQVDIVGEFGYAKGVVPWADIFRIPRSIGKLLPVIWPEGGDGFLAGVFLLGICLLWILGSQPRSVVIARRVALWVFGLTALLGFLLLLFDGFGLGRIIAGGLDPELVLETAYYRVGAAALWLATLFLPAAFDPRPKPQSR